MRLQRGILTGREAVVLSWKNILTSVFCILVLSVFDGGVNAQTTTQNFAQSRSNRFNQSAGQIADRSSFRERLTSADDSERPNAGTETPRRPLTSSEIWSSFLFGSLQPRTSTPKFVFSRKSQSNENNGTPSLSRTLNGYNYKPNQNVCLPTNEATNENERLVAMQRASDSFAAPNRNATTNANEQTDVSFNSNQSYVADDQVRRRTPGDSGAEERRRRIAELNASLDAREQGVRSVSYVEASDANATNETFSRSERSKIRQTSGVERRNKQTAENSDRGDGANEGGTLPVRPQALRISPRVFVSTEVVRLPQAGALVDEESAAGVSEEDALVAAASKKERAPEIAPLKEDVVYDIPTFNSQNESNAQTETVVPTPLEPSPLPLKSEKRSSESRVLRSKASFIDPKSI